MVASSGCFFAHLSYSLRIARLASSFFMVAMHTPSGRNKTARYSPPHFVGDALLTQIADLAIGLGLSLVATNDADEISCVRF